jgi:formylglycine-generating enzyme required for sulfatase activity
MGDWNALCPGCFKPKENIRLCPHCGFDDGATQSSLVLPLRTVLNNQYVVGRVLGSPGGFGITYLGWDVHLQTCVAIKEFLPREYAMRETDRLSVTAHTGKDRGNFQFGLQAFLEEARTVAKLVHPNIVRVKTYLEQNHTAYLVMEYYDGLSVAEYVRQKGGRIPEKSAVGIMQFVLDGLRHVHENGYLHRDVKPANIYVTKRGQVILLDFGAARYALGEHSRSLSVIVSPGYSPFEQYRSNGKQGPWTDVYACGATLYYLVTGQTPPTAVDRTDEDDPALLIPPLQLSPGLSPQVGQAIQKALTIKASDRPQNTTEFLKMLTGVTQSPVPGFTPQPMPAPASSPKPMPAPSPKPASTPKPADTWTEPATGMVFVWVPGGCYMMGCGDCDGEGYDDEKPVHEVCVDGFWMGQTAVTQGQWQRVMGSNPSSFKEGDNYPVEQVSWEDAKEYIRKLNGMGNAKFRLPSEAEWEYAARSGGKAEKYSGGSDLDSVAWYSSNSGYSTHPVRTKKGNGLGIYDMSGNVWEWCEDVYIADIYSRSDKKNPIYNSGGPRRVGRGGSWGNGPDYVRCAYRDGSDPAFRYFSLGFRLLRMP